MIECSILTSAFALAPSDRYSFLSKCAENLGTSPSDLEIFGLVPLSEIQNPSTVVIQVKSSHFSLSKLEQLICQREQLFQQLEKAREAIFVYSERAKEAKEPIIDEKITRKIIKLEDDNKKLRMLLK